MYELLQAVENSFYRDCPTKVGFYRASPTEVVLFDSGSDKDAAKKVKRILDAQGWQLKAILTPIPTLTTLEETSTCRD